MELILFIAMVWLGVLIHNLRARVTVLEKKLQAPISNVQTETHAPQHAQAHVAEPSVAGVHTPMYTQTQAPEPPYDDWLTSFLKWCATDWLMKLGALLVLLGVGWFVSYAFAHNWIGPMGRIGLGLAAGAVVLGLGRYRMVRDMSQGAIVMTVGAATMILTLYAAREVYDFFTPISALTLMFAISALLGTTAVVLRYAPLAYANALLAGVAPLLVASADPSLIGLSVYLLVLSVGAVWVVVLTGWREVVLLSFLVVCLHSVGMLVSFPQADHEIGLLFAFAFASLFFLAALSGMVRARTESAADIVTAALGGVYLYIWIMAAASTESQSLLFTCWAAVYALGAYLAFQRSGVPTNFYAYGGVAVVYLGTTTALLLDGPDLVITFALEALVLIVLSHLVTRSANTAVLLAGTMALPMVLSTASITSRAWQNGVIHKDSFALIFMCVVLAAVGAYMRTYVAAQAKPEEREVVSGTAVLAFILAGMYLGVLTWLVTHALYAPDTGTFIALVLYTLAASGFYVHGKQNGRRWERIAAGILVGGVVARLLLVDIWDMQLAGRVVTFLSIGALLMVVAWLERNVVCRTLNKAESEQISNHS